MADSNKESYDKIFTSLEKHHEWFENSIPLIASENIPSPAVREAVMSDFGNRYAEGWPGERVYACLLYTSPSPRDATLSRMPSSA